MVSALEKYGLTVLPHERYTVVHAPMTGDLQPKMKNRMKQMQHQQILAFLTINFVSLYSF